MYTLQTQVMRIFAGSSALLLLFDVCLGILEIIVSFPNQKLKHQMEKDCTDITFELTVTGIMRILITCIVCLIIYREDTLFSDEHKFYGDILVLRTNSLFFGTWAIVNYYAMPQSCHHFWMTNALTIWNVFMIEIIFYWICIGLVILYIFMGFASHMTCALQPKYTPKTLLANQNQTGERDGERDEERDTASMIEPTSQFNDPEEASLNEIEEDASLNETEDHDQSIPISTPPSSPPPSPLSSPLPSPLPSPLKKDTEQFRLNEIESKHARVYVTIEAN